MAVEDYGQIGGHDVDLGAGMDDLCSADGGQAAAQTIVADQDVVGVIGTSCSGAATAASPLISEAGIVMISGSNTSPALTSDLAGTAGKNYNPGYYRTAHNDLYQGAAAANFALDVLGVTTAAAIHDGDPYTEGLATAFADAFAAGGGTVTGFTAVNKGDSDMVPVLTEVAAGSPEMLFFPIFQPEGDFIVQQASTVSGLENTTMMAADGLLNSNFLAVAETQGMFFSGPDVRYGSNYNQSTGETAADVLGDYKAEFGESPAAPFWAHSYDATTLLLDAIAAASYDDGGTLVIDRAGVREHLNGVTGYSGLIGTMACDAYGDCSSSKITVIQNIDTGDYEASTANVVYEYAPLGSNQVGDVAAPPTTVPLEGAVIRVGVEAETDGLNPTVNRFAVSAYQMARAVLEPLVYVTDDPCGCVFAPGLAESWTVSDDNMTWDFKIRENVQFHDGTTLTGEAVVYAVTQQLKDPLISLALRPIFIAEGAVELLDDMTVRFNLKRPHVDFAAFLASQLGLIPSLEYMRATISDQSLNQAPVGTGPFKFASREQDFMTRFERNEDWWQGEVTPAAIEFYVYTDSVLAADAMAVGDIDILHSSNVDAILTLRDLESSGDVVLFEEDGGEEGFGMLNTSKAPFDDIRARKALAFSASLDDYMEFIGQGVLRPADSWFTPESPYHNPNVKQVHDLPDQATPLVAEYCAEFPDNCADGRINMEFQYSGPSVMQDRIYDVLTDGWSDHFNTTKDMKPQDAHINEVAFGQYDFVTWRQMGIANPDGDVTWLNCTAVGFVSLNWPRLCDEERDALMYQARGSSDQDEKIGIWKQVAEMINADYAYLMFTHTLWAHAYSPDVAGVCDYRFPDGSVPRCNYSGYTDYFSQLDMAK